MSYENICFENTGRVARLIFNRAEKLNSFTAAMHAEIRDALAHLDTGTRVLLVTGAGRGFCAGQDLDEIAPPAENSGIDLVEAVERDYAPLVRGFQTLPLPVVCAVNGVAAGAGANLAFACDLVMAKRSATFLQPFCKLGLAPDTGGTYFLPRLVGPARAMGLAMLGVKITAQQAADWGLIWKCVDDAVFETEVEALLAQLAASPTRALALTKWAIHASAHGTLEQQLMLERDAMRELGRTRDYREGVQAFLNKRTPEFYGR